MRRFGLLVLGGLLTASPRPARSDLVTTTDGKVHEGKVVSDEGGVVVVETTFDGRKELPRASVKSVDRSVPPLREQLAFRTARAGDAKAVLEVVDWAKGKGFKDELAALYARVIELEPQNARARRALGHVKVGAAWMSPEEKAAAESAAVEAERKAKGLVEHEGRWVTPEEKDALQRGLVKDGDAWVTEEELHRRRGERKVGGAWVKVGEKEGQARAAALTASVGVPLQALWGPHVDVIHEIGAADAKTVLDGAEKGVERALALLLAPDATDKLRDLRIQVLLFDKATPYARFVEVFDEENHIRSIRGMEGWSRAASRQKSFWWPDPGTTAHYLFPNPAKNVVSGAVHNLAMVLLTRHRFNYRFSSTWLQEGFAYAVELDTLGYSDSYTVGRGGVDPGDGAPWMDAKQWRTALKGAVAAGKDPPASRLATAGADAFGLVELVKAWSLVEMLVRIDPAKFRAFVDGSKAKGATEEAALQAAYGMDFAGLDRRWKQYVQAGFRP